MDLFVEKVVDTHYILTNCIKVSSLDFNHITDLTIKQLTTLQ